MDNFMARGKAKRKRSKGPIAMLLVLAGIIVWAWQAYGKRMRYEGNGMGTGAAAETDNSVSVISDLTEVNIPPSLNARMLTYPGFTVSFNADTHQPNYVAWELTRDEAQSQKTSRHSASFAPDPEVEGCATLDDYRRSGYDRGHMAPAGDMKWDSVAMQSSFLLTNISPQAHDLNQGSWRALEEKCRDWAVRDSAIVIVCGPIFDSHPAPTIGQTGVAVPDRYFKVVLAPYADPPRAIGFVMPNGKVPGGMQTSAMPVDDIEALTGYDFFPALPDDVEERVEAECNFPRWSKKKL